MIKEYFKLALNSLIYKKLRSWLTLLGIFIGVMAVVALIGLGDGLKTAITSQFGISSTEVITVQAGGISGAGPPGMGVVNPITDSDVEAIDRLSTVRQAIPRILQQGKLEYNDIVGYGFATTIPDGDARDFVKEALDVDAEFGRLLKDGDYNKVVLGHNFYSDEAGFEKKIRVGDNVLVQDKKFVVIGILEKKGSFIFDNIVLMNVDPLKDLFGIDDRVDIVAVQVKDKRFMDKAKVDIEKILRKRRGVKEGEEDFEVSTPEAALSDVNSILTGVQIFIVIIASISIVIGAIGIVNTMFTSVMERKKQIGVMKSIGAKNSDVFFIFFFESGMMGLFGGLLGTLFGTIISYFGTMGINQWVNASSSPSINFTLIALALSGSFLIGSISGILPAMRAAKEHPVDALRG